MKKKKTVKEEQELEEDKKLEQKCDKNEHDFETMKHKNKSLVDIREKKMDEI